MYYYEFMVLYLPMFKNLNSLIPQIFIGQYLEFTLNDTLNYGPTDTSTHLDLGLTLIISIASLFLLVIMITVTLLCVGLVCKKARRKGIRDQPR